MKDLYTLPDGTLKNKLGITDYDELKQAECDICFTKLISLDSIEYDKNNEELLKKVHKYIFGDIFEWAGEYRKVPIYKQEIVIPGISLEYAEPREIKTMVQANMKRANQENWNPYNLKDFSQKLTRHLAKIWRVHPFRDGNTRTTLAYGYLFAKEHGVELNMETFLNSLSRKYNRNRTKIKEYSIRDKFVLAALDEDCYPEPEHLEQVIRRAIVIKDKNRDER